MTMLINSSESPNYLTLTAIKLNEQQGAVQRVVCGFFLPLGLHPGSPILSIEVICCM